MCLCLPFSHAQARRMRKQDSERGASDMLCLVRIGNRSDSGLPWPTAENKEMRGT